MTASPLGESLSALTRFFVGDGTFEETLQRVAELTVEAVGPADFAGLTMMVAGQATTAVFTDEASPEIDETQYQTGEGPCLDAFREQQLFVIDSTAENGRWPAFRATCVAHGVASTMSLPLIVDKNGVGAMNLYAHQARAFSETDRQTGTVFASQAAIVLANAQAYWDSRNLSERLGDAMKSRAIIEQAKGVLMSAQHFGEDEAFEMLVRASQRENVKVRDIAARIIATATAGTPATAAVDETAQP